MFAHQRNYGIPYGHIYGAGEMRCIPKGSGIEFFVSGHARFLYLVYPADWQNQQ